MKHAFTFIDLFAGIGGFRLALESLGGTCVFSSEWDKAAQVTYEANFGEAPLGDITLPEIQAQIPDSFDLLCAGFPCQAFSIAGYQKGFSDTRGTLFFEIEKILEAKKPKAFILENVKNLQNHDKGRTFRVMLEVLEKKLNYQVFYQVLNSMTHANVPQNRERIFIIGFDVKKVTQATSFTFPEFIPLTQTIHDVLEQESVADKYYFTENHPYMPLLQEAMISRDTLYQWRRVYVRENKSKVCPTLTANMGTGGHNVPLWRDDFGIRKLTPRECFRFQGFPDSFVLPPMANGKLYKQAGNSVTVPLITRVAKQVLKMF